MRIIYLFVLSIFCFCLLNCSQDQSPQQNSYAKSKEYASIEMEDALEIEAPRTSSPPPPPLTAYTTKKTSKIIKSGNMALEVNSLKASKTKLDSLLQSLDAYYEDETYNSSSYNIAYHLRIRVPSSNLETLIQAIENGNGKLVSKNINAQDVTEEYRDLNIRLKNKLAYLEQYKTILKKAKSVQEVLEVQKEIRVLEEEIESKKGRLKFIDDKVNYSTLHLEITETISRTVDYSPSFGKKILNAFNDGINTCLDFFLWLIEIWPFLILLIILFLSRHKIRRLIGS